MPKGKEEYRMEANVLDAAVEVEKYLPETWIE